MDTTTRAADWQLVDTWIGENTPVDRAPDAVWAAHLRLQPDGFCGPAQCSLCSVFCEECARFYPRTSVCTQH
jgi:hypothetical protein